MADLTKELIKTIKDSEGKGTKPYDTTATVKRVKDGVAYVHIAGGVDETPVKLTINAKAGDEVQVRVADGKAFLVGNQTAPPTDNTMAKRALNYGKIANDAAVKATKDALVASEAASSASASAREAKETTDEINAYAETAGKTITQILNDGETAGTAAQQAKSAADTAFTNLSQVQSVLEVAEWIATHGTYTKATTFNPNATYYTITATQVASPSDDDKDSQGVLIYYEESGGVYTRTADTEVDPLKTYYNVSGTPVAGAKAEDIAQYYTLAVSDAMADYIQSHLALTDEGLWLIKDGSGYKLKLTNYGSYIVAPDGTTVVNQNTADGNIIRALDGTVIAHLGYGEGQAESGTAEAPYFTFGTRQSNSVIGNLSMAEGLGVTASGYSSHAEGNLTEAIGEDSHAEGAASRAIGYASHAEGGSTVAEGLYSHAQNFWTEAGYNYQTVIGKYNDNQSDNAFEIGNGTDLRNRSNSFAVDWDGNVYAQGMTGMIQMFAGATAPSGWLICNGQAVSREDYSTLFNVIGTTYGSGDGSTTFNLPDLRGRFPLGIGNGTATGHTNHTLGEKDGNENLIVPYHRHSLGDVWSGGSGSTAKYMTSPNRSANTRYTEYAGTSGNATGANMPPYIGLNFIICTGKTS